MEDWPQTKTPQEFTGRGWEIIGDPSDAEQITLHFRDGIFDMIEMPGRELPRPETEEALHMRERKKEVERLALHLREHPKDQQAKGELRAMPKDRTAQRAAQKIKTGGPLTDWPFQIRRERAAIVALLRTAEEYDRPPTEPEVISRMKMLTSEDMMEGTDGLRFLQGGEDKHLAKLLREMGLSWLEHRPRGRPRGR